MLNSFKNILIPVDFSVNTDVAIKKAMDLAEDHTIIHLLHVQNDSGPGRTFAARG